MDYILGTVDASVLFDQENHISNEIWKGKERGTLETIENSKLIRKWNLTNNQKAIIERLGFGLFIHPKAVQHHDDCLISALVERWRSETNSFHFRTGEMTITLEDVGFILGLPVMGKPVTWGRHESMKQIAFKELGMVIPKNAYGNGGLKFTWLFETFGRLPDNHRDEDVWLYTKAYLLFVIGAILFPTRTKNTVHPKYLLFLNNMNEVHCYAWGAAVLAYLYRALHKATRIDAKAIAGCLTLLQVWAYERISVGRPIRKPKSDKLMEFDKVFPRAQAWKSDLYGRRREDPHHNLLFYRSELDVMHEGQVKWQPYLKFSNKFWELGDKRGDFTLDVIFAGLAQTPVIYFDIVEYQMPDRVMRQLNYLQHIPRAAVDMRHLRIERGQSFDVLDAALVRAPQIEIWNMWQETLEVLVSEVHPVESIQAYHVWYKNITRTRIHPPSMTQSLRYQPKGVFDQQWALDLIEGAHSIFKQLRSSDCFEQCVPTSIRSSMTRWEMEYQHFTDVHRGPRTWVGQPKPETEQPILGTEIELQSQLTLVQQQIPEP